ncbi:unnamed protein product [Blepharisma stoltei]|uniref:RBR-type E3 ubiquitin transferase n=1 Tax=Blepharisma stoltei TaxID=1481888 RepID=A0AAU9JMQ2_9CILI|nr:unnamed protein product [Blepharisma stoltei]
MAESKVLDTCADFLAEILNKKSASANSTYIPQFIEKFSQILNLTEMNLKVTVKPYGKNCLHCGKYIPSYHLSSAIGLWCKPNDHFFCSAHCLQRHSLISTNGTLLDLDYVRCPICRSSISPEQINEAFDGKLESYQRDACDRALLMLLDEEGKEKLKAKFTCLICYTEFKVDEGITLECDHRFCINCIKQQVEMLIESAQVSDEKLKCPMCPQALSVYEIEDIVGPELFAKYEKFRLRGIQLPPEDENSYIFHCRGADCEYICIIEKGVEEFNCPKCGFKCCPLCKDEIHKGSTCEEFAKLKKEKVIGDEEFEKLLRDEGLLKCPECGAAVQRISGCQYMVCSSSQCQGRTYFCYDCGIKLEQDHGAHDCKPREGPKNQPANVFMDDRMIPGVAYYHHPDDIEPQEIIPRPIFEPRNILERNHGPARRGRRARNFFRNLFRKG